MDKQKEITKKTKNANRRLALFFLPFGFFLLAVVSSFFSMGYGKENLQRTGSLKQGTSVTHLRLFAADWPIYHYWNI